jgi:hypothetical protein
VTGLAAVARHDVFWGNITMRLSIMIIATVLASAGTAFAADEEIIKGVYLKSKALCAKAKKETLQPVIEDGNLVLTNRGLDSIEYNCAFVQVIKHPRLDNAWIATAYCEEPGFSSPDVFSITKSEDGNIALSSLEEGNVENSTEGGETGEAEADEGTEKSGAADTSGSAAALNEPAPEDEASFAGIGGTYYQCDGVTMP